VILLTAARELGQIVEWLVAVLAGPGSDLYGGYDLQEGDHDAAGGAAARYGGQDRPGLAPATHVQDLHRDLRELGFGVAPAAATAYDRLTRWAVQEFQRYAALNGAASQRPAAGTTAAVTAAQVTLPVDTPDGFPDAAPFQVRVEQEELTVTAGAGTAEFTVTRAANGTAAAAHPAGSPVTMARWSDGLLPESAWFYERYPGQATGVVNAWTRFVLERWKAERWRCPVVVEAWDMQAGQPARIHQIPAAGGQPARPADNLWLHTEVPLGAPRIFVRDLTTDTWAHPARPPLAAAHPELDIVGQWTTGLGWDGPIALPERLQTWRPEGEMLPENLLPRVSSGRPGPTLAELVQVRDDAARPAAERDLAGRQLATYKVVRAVAEVEAVGYFDGINAWDNAFISLGPCHWTAGPVSIPAAPQPPRWTWGVRDGELWGFLAYLKAADRPAFDAVLGRFGLDVESDWGVNGQALFLGQLDRKYVSRPVTAQESGVPQQMQQIVAEFDAFRSWHWFYRFIMAGRTADGFRRRMWHMARLRIRDLLGAPWDALGAAATIPDIPDPRAPGGGRRVRIGDVLTSERSVALAYRWHILSPGGMVSNGRAGNALRTAFAAAAAPANPGFAGDPTGWGDAQETALVQAILNRAAVLFPPDAAGNPSSMVTTLAMVDTWPSWGANARGFTLPVAALPAAPVNERLLLTGRGSFAFDGSDLPLPAL
jgi:hypothetical protein